MSPFFSIIIPTLNEEKFLPELLANLANQEYKDFEVIVVDAHSEDTTVEKANVFDRELRITCFESPQRKLTFQRNYGAQNAQGQYLIFLDADASVDSHFLQNLHQSINHYQHLIYLPLHMPKESAFPDEFMYKLASFLTELSHLTDKPFAYGPGAVFYKPFFEFLGGYDEDVFVYEDHEIVQRARKRGVHAQLLDNLIIYFSMRRFENEGRLKVISKYLTATMILLTKGKVQEEYFEYEMGGSAKYLTQQKKQHLSKNISFYLEKIKKILEE